VALFDFINVRQNLTVPNIHWGLIEYECDLLAMTDSGYLTEYEIKISKADLKKDLEKKHTHDSKKIKYLYFAIPKYLYIDDCINMISKKAGIITVERQETEFKWQSSYKTFVQRGAEQNTDYKLKEHERFQFARLGALRVGGLKRKLHESEQRLQKIDKATDKKCIWIGNKDWANTGCGLGVNMHRTQSGSYCFNCGEKVEWKSDKQLTESK